MRDAHLAPCSVCTFFFILAHVLLRHYEPGLLSEHISKESGVCSVCWLMVSIHLKLWVKPTFQSDMGSLWSISLFSQTLRDLVEAVIILEPQYAWALRFTSLISFSLSIFFFCVCNCCDPLEWGGVFMPVIFKDIVSHLKNSISEKSTPKSLCQVLTFS